MRAWRAPSTTAVGNLDLVICGTGKDPPTAYPSSSLNPNSPRQKNTKQTGQSLLARALTGALEPLVSAAAACQAYPEAMHAVLAFLRDYAEVHVSSLGVRLRLLFV